MALVPDLVLHLDVDVETLVPRVVQGKGMDYWESGMHLALGTDLFDSFIRYQRRLIDEYRSLADEFGFLTIDARRSIDDVQTDLRTHITEYLHKVTNHHAEADVQAGASPSSRKD
jgi:dTMP kinase